MVGDDSETLGGRILNGLVDHYNNFDFKQDGKPLEGFE